MLDHGSSRRTIHSVMLAHAVEYDPYCLIGLIRGFTEYREIFGEGVLHIARGRNHGANERGRFDDRIQSLLHSQALDQVMLCAIQTHVGKISDEERAPNDRRSHIYDIIALLFFETENQISVFRQLSRELTGPEFTRINAHAVHQTATRRIDGMTDQSMRASTRNSNGGTREVSPHQQLAHGRPADVARADKHDMHGPCSFLDDPRTAVQC